MRESGEQLRFVEFGGGTGSQVVLEMLRPHAEAGDDVVAVVPASDDGGSSGRLSEEFGIAPLGDARAALTSMARNPDQKERYSGRREDEHSIGNLILKDWQIEEGLSQMEALERAQVELDTFGRVIPVAEGRHTLGIIVGDTEIFGESNINKSTIRNKNAKIQLVSGATLTPGLEEVIHNADHLIISPSNFRISVLAIMAVKGFREAIRESKGELTFISPLLSVPGHSDGWHVADFVEHLQRYYIDEGRVNNVLHHLSPINPHLLEYARPGEREIATHEQGFERIRRLGTRVIAADIVLSHPFQTDPKDMATHRTKIRQSPELLGNVFETHIMDTSRQKISA
jgi:uncharacterized cofD-like protein